MPDNDTMHGMTVSELIFRLAESGSGPDAVVRVETQDSNVLWVIEEVSTSVAGPILTLSIRPATDQTDALADEDLGDE